MKQHRGVVVAKNGMVAASQPLAVSAGLNALLRGGTFVDAALATSATLAVIEPSASHIGGDAFVIVYDAKTGTTTALNGSGASPLSATPERFSGGIPLRGLAAASVPGLVDTWFALHERWGRLPVADLLAPAIAYAEDGFPLSYRMARVCGEYAPLLRQHSPASSLLLDDPAPRPGHSIRQPDLAWTLRQIAQEGRDAFYNGPVTARLLEYSQANGGLFTADDFAAHRTQISDPIRSTYRGYTVHGQPPVSQGHILLQELNLVEGFDLSGMGHNSADAIHVQVEAKKLAFADRAAYLGDPRFVNVPLDTLLSKDYADTRRSLIDMQHAQTHATAGEIHHDTTYFCIVDGEGNAISFIQSVFYVFGCGVFVPGTGVLFNNRMTGFSLDPASPNVLAPGKRTAHTLNAYLVTKGEGGRQKGEETDEKTQASALAFVGGTPGADVQVQSNLQVICNVIDFGMNPQEAIEAARWQHGPVVTDGGTPESLQREGLAIEERLDPGVKTELERRGHETAWLGPWAHSSSYQLIAIDAENGAYLGGSDPRCDGHAAGY
jgi:gamma-glutamyltranspeptidase/glutathione hydrolase